MSQQFDILDYFNQLYMNKVVPTIDITQQRSVNEKEKEMNKNKKKRIHIPDARITKFQYRANEHNETNNDEIIDESERRSEEKSRYRDNEISNRRSKKTTKRNDKIIIDPDDEEEPTTNKINKAWGLGNNTFKIGDEEETIYI